MQDIYRRHFVITLGMQKRHGRISRAKTLAAEARSSNIRVNSVEPGYVATKLTGFQGSKPESVTDVFVYLASDESKGVTGKMLSSSGWRSERREHSARSRGSAA